jgi:hypothetical protein
LFWPPRILQTIVDSSPEAFPTFNGDQLKAYNYISCNVLSASVQASLCTSGIPNTNYSCILSTPSGMNWGGGVTTQNISGLRCEYNNLAAASSLAGYQSQMNAKGFRPKNIPESDWKSVVVQLNAELTDVETVQGLYSYYTSFYNSLFINNQTLLDTMILDAGITAQEQDTTMVSGKTLAILEGVLYTAIEGAGGLLVGPFGVGIAAIGNLMETGINGAVANGSVSDESFQVAVRNLWSQLSSDFTSILTASGDNETSILDDWGRLQAVTPYILSTGPDSLALSATTASQLVSALEPGFEVAAMRMLLPAKYLLDPIPQTTVANLNQIFEKFLPDPPPSSSMCVAGSNSCYDDYFQPSLGNGVFNYSALASGANEDHFVTPFPGQQAIQNDLFDNGVSQFALFNNLNGWSFPLSWTNWNNATYYEIPSATGCNQLIVSVINQTGNDLTLFLKGDHGSLLGSTTRDFPAYATDVVGLKGDAAIHGPEFTFCVSNAGSSCSGDYVQFEVQQNNCSTAAGNITYTESGGTYESAELSETKGSYANNIPGVVSVAVYNPSASQ